MTAAGSTICIVETRASLRPTPGWGGKRRLIRALLSLTNQEFAGTSRQRWR